MDIQHNDPEGKQTKEELRASKERYRLLVENIDGVIYAIDTQANITYISPTIEQIFGYTADEILGQKRAEEALRECEVRLNLTIEGANLGIWDWDVASDEVVSNSCLADMLGYPKEELDGKMETWLQRAHPEDRSLVEKVQQDLLDGSVILGDVEFRLRCSDGNWRWARFQGKVVLRDDTGHPLRMTGIMQDITERKRMEDEMRSERELSRSIVEGADFFIVGFDRQGKISLFNRGGEIITGHRAGDVLGMNFFDLLIPDRAKATFRDHIEALAEGRSNDHMDGPVLTCSGEEVHLQWGWSVIRGESGEIERIIAFGQDISYKRWLEEQMFLFLDAIESSNDGIAIFGGDGCLIFANPALLDMCGAHLEDVRGRSYKDFILETEEGLQIEGNSWQGRVSCIRTDGTNFPASVSVAPVADKDGRETAIIAVVRDISQSVEYEQKLKSLNSELERFAYTVSHDLRAPLRGIKGFATVLQEDYGDRLDETGRRYLDRIGDISTNMDRLVLDLLDYSRVGRIVSPPQKVDLRDLVTEAYEDVKSLACGGEVEFTITGDFPVMSCERSRIKQVFANLLSNSLKYAQGAPVIEVGCINQGDAYEFYVTDEGIGFDMDYIDRIFEPFIRLKIDGEGTGIGLATAKKIVETCGGKIWAESSPGKGSTFRFTLPNK